MVIEEIFAAIHEKEQVLQNIRAEAQRLEKEIETLRAAIAILEKEAKGPKMVEPVGAGAASSRPAETIRKAFP